MGAKELVVSSGALHRANAGLNIIHSLALLLTVSLFPALFNSCERSHRGLYPACRRVIAKACRAGIVALDAVAMTGSSATTSNVASIGPVRASLSRQSREGHPQDPRWAKAACYPW